ncbi:AGAP013363-PA-like protein [Anopheles sinensis]|uniref:AGAP013363-PA-like protein n=1 Tax=Anopheles sinensis TaxID=74873 RepID=A0A084VWM3_ANOSI|nr:AGAP013363-PA-like protein [Anopheles sinensis]
MWLIVGIFIRSSVCEIAIPPQPNISRYDYLLVPLARHYRMSNLAVNFCLENDVRLLSSSEELDTINALLHGHMDWMVVTVHYSTQCGQMRFFQNVFLAATYRSLEEMVSSMDYECYDAAGFYMVTVADRMLNETSIVQVFGTLWKYRIINVVFIAPLSGANYRAYSFDPYQHTSFCGSIQLVRVDRYVGHRWQILSHWFRGSMRNFHGCPLRIGTIEAKPFSMVQQRGGKTVYMGLEVDIMKAIARRLNFSFEFVTPPGRVKWGVLRAGNSTGLMGMILRAEVDFGFGAVGHSPNRSQMLRSSYPGIITQMIMAIPPRRPHTSLEKLFQPFSPSAWTLIVVCYSVLCALSVVVCYGRRHPSVERMPGMFYTFWIILLGGPGGNVRRHSTRIYVISLLLNAFVVRNLYQSALFRYLKSSDLASSKLHTYDDINAAGLYYYMYPTSRIFFVDNPWVNNRIRTLHDEELDWDEVMYNISQHRLPGVLTLPLESISYYVKYHGQRGMVYVGQDTGISYYIGFHFPRMSALKDPFDRLLHRFYDAGLIVHWKRSFRDNPNTWIHKNEDKDNVPTPLHLHQLSGGFYLWAFCTLLTIGVFVTEVVRFKINSASRH